MLVTAPNLNLFFTDLNTQFWMAYGTAPVSYQRLTTTVPVGTEVWTAGWIGMLNKMREWIGPRITNTPAPQTYSVTIQAFEQTNGIDQFKLEDDQWGIYSPVASFMGMQSAKWPDYQLRDLIQSQGSQGATRQNCMDLLTFWNTAHPVNFYDASFGTFPNDFTGGGVSVNGITVGGSLSSNSFMSVWEDMTRRKQESGESWGLTPDLLTTGSMLKGPANAVLNSQFIAIPTIGSTIGTGNFPTAGSPVGSNAPLVGSTTNPTQGWSDHLLWADLGGSATVGGGSLDQVWYLFDTKRVVRPFMWLLRQAPNFVIRNKPDDPIVYDSHTISMGSVARGAPAFGFPAFASRSGA